MEEITQNEKNLQQEEKKEYSFDTVRSASVRILSRFERSDSYIDKLIISEHRANKFSDLDKALLTELVNGVIRWKMKLDWVLVGFYHGDFLKCLNIVKNAMRVALYQILFLNKIPIPAAVNEAVEFVKRIQGEKTAGIVNAVLRNISKNIENIRYPDNHEDLSYSLSIIHSHPRWMVRRWLERFTDEETVALLEANNRKPYTALRVNTLKSDAKEIEEVLNRCGVKFYQSPFLKESFILNQPRMDFATMQSFSEGKVTIQDTSSALVVKLANPKKNMKIIDLCAAPGGKTCYLAELAENQAHITASDKYKAKLRFIEESAIRLGLENIRLVSEDATEADFEEIFDLALCDVPCTGLGTLSKKPDIKWKRDRDDIPVMVDLQRKIMENAATLLKKDGILIYSTCSIEPEENTENVKWFLSKHQEFELDPAENYLPKEVCKDGFLQTFPHIHKIDGAFAARMIKKYDVPLEKKKIKKIEEEEN